MIDTYEVAPSRTMVRYHIHDGNKRIATAEALAREHAPDGHIQSFVSDGHYVISADDRQLVIDLRRHKYDIRVGSKVVGKYTSWDDAKAKFETLLKRTDDTTRTSA
jgi:hypothetical protein